MPLTFYELLERLKKIDEVSLLEVLQLTSGDIVDRFEDRISDNYDYLIGELDDEEEDDEED